MTAKIIKERLSDNSFVHNVHIFNNGEEVIIFNCISINHAIDLIDSLEKNTVDIEI